MKDKRTEIIAWLKSRELLSKNALEKKVGMLQGVLSKALKNKTLFSGKHTHKLIEVLSKYGYKK